jgi:prephenate dehydrogenase
VASPAPFPRVGVAGLGLIGGSVALAAKSVWPDVVVHGCDVAAHVDDARTRGVVSDGATDIAVLATCDLIVLAVPLGAMRDVLRALGQVRTNAIITDVGSTKRGVIATAKDVGLRQFVGGHPMAGGERPGLDQARADLFVDRPWLLVEGTANADARARVEAFARGLGARPSWMAADEHDRTVAYVSHLPQVVAAALMTAADDALGIGGKAAAGPAFAEMTRLASSPPDMWTSVLAENADFVAEALAQFARDLPSIADLQSGAWARDVLRRAGETRARWRSAR